ncbi:MAG: alanine--tRNA ligase [Spirochaetes bacterium]|nr:alanine--tRNA ligase [Spirochaetota bacterium]
MDHHQLRNSFLLFFEQYKHKSVSSSPVIPYDDPTLMFTNAGMNQFKQVLLGNETRSYKRAASVQKCIRVSGKHNDFEVVGFDGYHHTFFEMLGNWSFGDYYKKEAIEFAWEYLTRVLKIKEKDLFVSVYKDDEESFNIWNKTIKVPHNRIAHLGDIEKGNEENFWSMGETGPCGPCTEIYFDLGEKYSRKTKGEGIGYDERYMELWNLVFMEFYRDSSGQFSPLKFKSVDTGMGFERLYALLEGKFSNYHTDLFSPLMDKIEEISEKRYKDRSNEVAFQVIADHIRAIMFAIADGGTFSNEGRGYILRKILRRAVRYFKKLDVTQPALYKLCDPLVALMGDFYPELRTKKAQIEKFIRIEEEKFLDTLETGLGMINNMFKNMKKEKKEEVSGKDLFSLYDTYGFPVDIVKEIAREHKYTIDQDGFNYLMEEQRQRGKKSWSGDKKMMDEEKVLRLIEKMPSTEMRCYETLETISRVLIIMKDGKIVQQAGQGDVCGILLDKTPFYGESGGQVGDKGVLETPEFQFQVEDTLKYGNRFIVHWGKVDFGKIEKDINVDAKVNQVLRQATARNHTATHLLQAALKKVLGSHISQAGSYVGPDRLRFDFRHFESLSGEQIERVEQLINEKIQRNLAVFKSVEDKEKALKSGAVAIFGEKYGETVRVVKAGQFSQELCGGTHIESTGEIGLFLIISESSIASGIRRIEAITGQTALQYIMNMRKEMHRIAGLLKVSSDEVYERVEKLFQNHKDLEKKIKQSKFSSEDVINKVLKEKIEKNDSSLIIHDFKGEEMSFLNSMADNLQKRIKQGIVFLVNQSDEKVNLILALTDDIVRKGNDASDLIKPLAKIIGGNGGGRKDRAQAGGKKVDSITHLLRTARDNLTRIL